MCIRFSSIVCTTCDRYTRNCTQQQWDNGRGEKRISNESLHRQHREWPKQIKLKHILWDPIDRIEGNWKLEKKFRSKRNLMGRFSHTTIHKRYSQIIVHMNCLYKHSDFFKKPERNAIEFAINLAKITYMFAWCKRAKQMRTLLG